MNKLFSFIFFCLINIGSTAQSNSSSEILLSLKKLNTLGSVLYIAAHPDDENTRLLTYFSKEKLFRTGYLSLTRGDGGQNLIGDEQGVALGLIRTQELLAARRIDGAEQFFTRAFDFGFSKTPEETFSIWNKSKILEDVVWVIRKFKPDVIITRFPTTGEGGHGHHTASAILANEAFTAAADPNVFKEQLKYVEPWQAKRIVWNTYNFGTVNTQSEDQYNLNAGGFNPLLGKSYGEIAAESRSQHKSQGFGVAKSRGEAKEYFILTGGSSFKTDLFEAVNTSWNRVNGAGLISETINSIIKSFDINNPSSSIPSLVLLYKELKKLPESYWRNRKLNELINIIENAGGLWLESFTKLPTVAQKDSFQINFVVNDRTGAGFILNRISIEGFDTALHVNLLPNQNFTLNKTLFVPATKDITQPYWLKHAMNEGSFTITNQEMIGEPDVAPAFMASITVSAFDESFTFKKPVVYKHTDPVKGERIEPFIVVPPLTMNTEPVRLVNNTIDEKVETKLQITAQKNLDSSVIYNDQKEPTAWIPALKKSGVINEISRFYKQGKKNGKHKVSYFMEEGVVPAKTFHSIQYDHIPTIQYFSNAQSEFLIINLKTAGKKIGYIPGAGDKVPEALMQMGYSVFILKEQDLDQQNLHQYDAVITGIRAYNTNEFMDKYYNKLMDYVFKGGNLIVQYNTSNQIGPVKSRMGPFAFEISRNRVTEENATVEFLDSLHPVLNYPNKITEKDFDNWVQERSVYHAIKWSKEFKPVFSMHDTNQQADEGSLIIAKYGKGYFSYTGLSFFRQLPAGIGGAYRLMANLIALNKTNKAYERKR